MKNIQQLFFTVGTLYVSREERTAFPNASCKKFVTQMLRNVLFALAKSVQQEYLGTVTVSKDSG
jgi:hypothetical protein